MRRASFQAALAASASPYAPNRGSEKDWLLLLAEKGLFQVFIALWASLKLAEKEGFGVCLRQPQPLRRYTPSHEPPVDSPQSCLCGGSPSTGFESLPLLSAEKEFLLDGYYLVGWISKLAEEEGFEPSYPGIPDKRFSRPPHSTTLPPLRVGVRTARSEARRRRITGGESGI